MSTRRTFMKSIGAITLFSALPLNARTRKPNILWLSTEDISPHLGCYGYEHAHTPALDKLAAGGIRYSNAFTVAGVCAPNRSTIITGVHANSLGTHHMRAGGEGVEVSRMPLVPDKIKCFSEYLRDAGYYCTNNDKTDYNFDTPDSAWDECNENAHWKNRPHADTPFFSIFNYHFTHEGSTRFSPERHAEVTSRLSSEQRQGGGFQIDSFPPYYANTVLQRRQWAKYYELITGLDYWIADRLKELEEPGLADDTIVFFWSDHGVGMPRAKRWLYDSGTKIPLIVHIPKRYRSDNPEPGTVDEQLVSSVDFAPTVLNLTGLPIPDYMQGRAFLGKNQSPQRRAVFGARDRMDERYDIIRMVRNERYRYIRNYQPYKPFHQFMRSCENGPMMTELRELYGYNELTPAAEQFFAQQKPLEELYDLQKDPHEIHNLADDPAYADIKERLAQELMHWMRDIRDLAFIPEPELFNFDRKYGNRYSFFHEHAESGLFDRIWSTASTAGRPDRGDQLFLLNALNDKNPSVRYWAAIGLGNLRGGGAAVTNRLRAALKDGAPVVRVAAARALYYAGDNKAALPLLVTELQSDHEWVRLAAAHVLDEMGADARPAVSLLEKALEDKENKYVVRVANHALNVLNSTHNRVR